MDVLTSHCHCSSQVMWVIKLQGLEHETSSTSGSDAPFGQPRLLLIGVPHGRLQAFSALVAAAKHVAR